tara:strand:+ start:576 stop:749 length:174 start_codon:yes stop_codon:yes gene_type:complete
MPTYIQPADIKKIILSITKDMSKITDRLSIQHPDADHYTDILREQIQGIIDVCEVEL